MHVVRRFPPSDAEAAAEVCNERTDQCVVHKVAGDTAVASVVRCEHDLLLVILSVMARLQIWQNAYPKEAQEDGGGNVPLNVQEVGKTSKQCEVAQRLPGIC